MACLMTARLLLFLPTICGNTAEGMLTFFVLSKGETYILSTSVWKKKNQNPIMEIAKLNRWKYV